MALELVPQTAAARARRHPLGIERRTPLVAPSPREGAFGLRPQDLHTAYQLPTGASSAQTVAVVDAYNDPTAETDLAAYDEEFGLPACTAGNGCFRQVNENGETGDLPFPKTDKELEAARKGARATREEAEEATGWGLEISLDIEVAHATCQNCEIVLVEANAPSYEDLEVAEKSAAALGAGEISNSWAGPEEGETRELENAGPFNHAGIVITAAAGDDGYLNWDGQRADRGYVNFPASSPHVVAVGGTRLTLGAGGAWAGETVWNGDHATGGGCSAVFTAQPWQQSLSDWSTVGCGDKRAVADVSADADPYTGVAVHDTSPECEYSYEEGKVKHVLYWCTIGGTSLSTPLIASVFALAGGADGVAYPAETLYDSELNSPGALHDVTTGSNGECAKPFLEGGLSGCAADEEAEKSCSARAICLAGTGYDGPTGVGTPDGIAAFEAGSQLPNAPTVVTGAASSVAQTSAILNATVDPNGAEVTGCTLEYGLTTSYGSSVPCSPAPGSGSGPVAVSASVADLASGSVYHFRVVAGNAGGTGYGSDQTFTTLAAVQYGTCTKVAKSGGHYAGRYQDGNCTDANVAGEGRYEWSALAEGTQIAVTGKAGKVTLEAAGTSVVCKHGTLETTITGPTSTTETITLSRCAASGRTCTSAGQPAGSIRMGPLDGSLLATETGAVLTRYQSAGPLDVAEFECGAVAYALQGTIAGVDGCNVEVMTNKACETFAIGDGEQGLRLEAVGGLSEPVTESASVKNKSAQKLEIKDS